MKKIISIICVAGFFVCLLLMYTTDLGVNGLRKHDADFEMLDMSFHYTADDVSEAFEGLGADGIAAYNKFWILDYAFIACFLVVMLTVTNKYAKSGWIRNSLIILTIARAVCDIVENSMLLHLSSLYPAHSVPIATVCSWFTTAKFIALYIWIAGIAVLIVYSVIRRKRRPQDKQTQALR